MGYWQFIDRVYNTTFSLFFFIIAILMVHIAIKGYKANNRYGGYSTIACGVLFLFFGYYNSIIGYFPFPYNGFFVWWIGMILFVNFVFSLIIRKIVRKMEEEKLNLNNSNVKKLKKSVLRKYIKMMTKENPYKEKISLKMEYIRKSFHLLGLLIALAYFGFFFIPPLTELVNNNVILLIKDIEWSYNLLWGDINDFPYTEGDFQAVIDITLFALIGALALAIISDLIRVLWGAEYSFFNFLTRPILRNKEKNAAGPQIHLISGIILSYMFYIMGLVHILAVFAGISIACISDAAAAIIGRKFGSHKVKCIGGEIKSVEGFIAGVGSAYLTALICVGPIYALIAAFIFFLLDYFPTVIADNILNPILITIGIQIFVILLELPIGWQ